ncbi:MAG: 4Fe-4S binding protein [Bacillota bacterium]
MEWEKEALDRLSKVPFFVRNRVKSSVERYAREMGADIVTSDHVSGAKRNAFSAISQDTIDRLEKAVEKGADIPGLSHRFFEVRLCGGAAGCPLTLIEDERMARGIVSVIESSGFPEWMASRIEGPVLYHHKFRVAVSGCPNSCSEPQIRDFAVVGLEFPELPSSSSCGLCGACESVCTERAVILDTRAPLFDAGRCVGCGQCAAACPEGCISRRRLYRVLFGGRLGRHPRLAAVLLDTDRAEHVLGALRACLELYMSLAAAGERFGKLLERLGIEEARRMILHAALSQ